MRVLVACEFSGIVREAFKWRGHDAWSCDLLDTEIPGNHIKGDVLAVLGDGWDLMIAHPPCTYFANAGLHYLKTRPERQGQLEEAFIFIKELWEAPIPHIAIENPAGWLNTHWQKPSQIIQPYYFGEPERKTTCLWLKNLPPLLAKGIYYGDIKPSGKCYRQSGNRKGKPYNYYWRQGKNGHERSRAFIVIAEAMAEQWAALSVNKGEGE